MSRFAVLWLALVLGCARATHDGVGVVTDVRPDLRQILLDHEAIEGLMPAMTMNFDVADPALLAGISIGDRVRFAVEADAGHYRIVALEKVGAASAPPTGHGPALSGVVPEHDAAPGFALIDQDGSTLSLESLRGSLVLLDFIYTHCPGPCPILTSARVQLQKALPDALRPSVRFVSISLDPVRDTPAALRAYALARGADLATWSFLTGNPAAVDQALTQYGVGKILTDKGEIEHVVVT
ncbi:MAG: SCO family protein, partial [Solirubrobacteraceae bacterium]